MGGWSISSDDLEEIIKETKVSIFNRPMEYEKEEYEKQLKMWENSQDTIEKSATRNMAS